MSNPARASAAGRANDWPVPRLPVFGWQALAGPRDALGPCMLDLPGCVYTTSGRASITLALQVLGVQPGEPVLLPTYHCPTMVAPADGLGARPFFYPVETHGTPDLDWLSQQDLRGVRVMLAAHFFGLPQPMQRIRRWCDERGIALIEDCAHALFGSSDGRPIGSWGDVSIGSLTKFLPVPEGGCLVLNRGQAGPALQPCSLREEIKSALDIVEEGARHGRLQGLNRLITAPLDLIRRLRNPGSSAGNAPHGLEAQVSSLQLDDPVAAGFAIDMVLAQRDLSWACRRVAQRLPRQRIVARRRANHAAIVEGLAGLTDVRPLLPALSPDAAPYVIPLWAREPDPGYQALRAERIPVFRWDRLWPEVPDLPGDAGKGWSHHVIQLACHQDLESDDLRRMLRAVRRHLGHRA